MEHPPAFPFVLADWGAVVWIVAFLILSVLRAFAGDGEKKAPARPRRRPAPGGGGPEGQGLDDRAGAPKGAAAGAGKQRELRSEVDEFLRRVKQHQEPETPRADLPDPQPRRIQMLAPEDVGREAARARRSAESAAEARANESVADHVQQHVRHLKESQLAENAALLGSQVAMADDKVEARLKATFGREIGTLARRQEEPPAAPVDPVRASLNAEGIAAMLASPEGARNAIILSEILNRPGARF